MNIWMRRLLTMVFASKQKPKGGEEKQEKIPDTLEQIEKMLENEAGLNKSFDVCFREMTFGGQKTALFYINGFAKDDVLTEVIKRLTYVPLDEQPEDVVHHYADNLVAHIQVQPYKSMTEVIGKVMAGGTALFFDQATEALVIDAKQFPVRSTEEPDLERVVRGSRDGFVETLITNVTLVRRRIRDPGFMTEMMQVGKRTSTDICVGYIKDIADPNLIQEIKNKINSVELDGLPLAEKQLEEAIIEKSGWSTYPLVRYSERPDVISSHLLEGHVIIFVDTSPSVMIMPTTFFHHVQHAEEYRETPIVGTYLRWVRFIGIWMSLFLLPLWYLIVVVHPEMKPPGLEFLGPNKMGELSILTQFIIAELGLDLMRMASVHTPSPLAIAMGLVAAILVGDIAIKAGLFINEVILYLAVASIGLFATPSYELSLANRIQRLISLITAAIFGAPGFVIGWTLWLIVLCLQRSYNSPYMWPFIPFNAKGMLAILLRLPVTSDKKRPSLTRSIDNTRQPQKNPN
ncbi:spore germination protein [Paenibacillus sp. N1-5-1-14]|uniref:spore germination protein n=1 Tax=Paenibacillus radicibacter TaxID=2972488 RepID=UPI002158C145|nr:spore germination protein [Paenibacillus radicibacter]MCR8642355.1 spore germination protein [Paenibacillus radicibacter]